MSWLTGLFCFECIALFFAIVFRRTYMIQNEFGEIKYKVQESRFWLLICMLGMIFISACRNAFIDTADYRYMYTVIGRNIENVFNESVPRVEKGYLLFTYFLNLISTNSQFLLVVTSIIIILCFIYFFYRESIDVLFSIWLFFSLDFINTMNGIRQIMVAGIVSLMWIKWRRMERKIRYDIIFLCGIVLMSFFHTSVLICIPVFLASRGKVFNWKIRIIIIIAVLLFAVPSFYYSFFEQILGGSTYSDLLNTSATMGIQRFVVKSMPLFLIFINRYVCKNTYNQDVKTQCIVNISIINFCFSLLSLRMVYFARLSMYFNLFDYILIPLLAMEIFKDKSVRLFKIIVILATSFYYFIQLKAFSGYLTGFDLVIGKGGVL